MNRYRSLPRPSLSLSLFVLRALGSTLASTREEEDWNSKLKSIFEARFRSWGNSFENLIPRCRRRGERYHRETVRSIFFVSHPSLSPSVFPSVVGGPVSFVPRRFIVSTKLQGNSTSCVAQPRRRVASRVRRSSDARAPSNGFVYIPRDRFAIASEYFSRIPEYFASHLFPRLFRAAFVALVPRPGKNVKHPRDRRRKNERCSSDGVTGRGTVYVTRHAVYSSCDEFPRRHNVRGLLTLAIGSRTITSDRIVFNNSWLSSWSRRYYVTG